jgi:hypothetical protein
MQLEIAGESDNVKLLQFYESHPLHTWMDLKVERYKDFFAPYRWQSEDFRTYVLRDDDQSIQAVATFIFRDTFYNGKPTRIALATDLKVSSSRKAILSWGQHFLPVMEQIQAEKNLSHIFSHISLTETSVLNTFVRPRQMKRPLPRYFLFRKFRVVGLHGLFPFAPRPVRHLKIREGSSVHWDALVAFVQRRNQYRPFTTAWSAESLQSKMSRWPGFQLSDFLIAFDAQENIVGCLAPWSSEGHQDFMPLSYGLKAHNFRQALKFLNVVGMTKKLTKPQSRTGQEAPLSFQFLTNICVDNEDVFDSLLQVAFRKARKDQFLVYAHCDVDYRLNPPGHWIHSTIPHALYGVLPPSAAVPDFLSPSLNLNPEVEAAYLY